jgi:DNA-binding MarR family transcriptional regulator/GNAT superfamily N-acetyltransferase
MSAHDHVAAVRQFNRFYTRQIGLLQEGLLDSTFSLTEVRVMYELAHRDAVTAVDLCRDLGLDAGYVSRLLRGFEGKQLIRRAPSKRDARRNLLSLTQKGRKIFAPLDRKSSQDVASMLGRLTVAEKAELIGAMNDIERILQKPSGKVADYVLRDPQPGDMGWVVHRHGTLYAREWGYDWRFEALVAEIVAHFVQNLDVACEKCWIAERGGEILGFVFLVKKTASVAKLRLLLVEPSARGLGIGKRLVEECVRFAKSAGYKKIELWTQSELTAARNIYRQVGFTCVGEERHHSWGRKELVSEVWEKLL